MKAQGIETSWWVDTGKNAPFDKSGISSRLYRPLGSPEGAGEVSSRDLPDGALFASPAQPPFGGADGLSVTCILPDRAWWDIDGRASNCTMMDDRVHKCWVRHGTVGDRLTVDKKGNTCEAGAGSIQTKGWHGFLRDGRLVQ